MNKVIELMFQYSIYEYIQYILVALSFPIIMHILAVLFPQLFKTKQVIYSYLFTLSGIVFYLVYLCLGYFGGLQFTPIITLVYLIMMFLSLLNILSAFSSKPSFVNLVVPILLLAPISLTNISDWRVYLLFGISYLISSTIIFFSLRRYESE